MLNQKNKYLKFLLNLQFIFKRCFWIMNDTYSADWDQKLNELLDNYKFTEVGEYTALLGNIRLWIGNYPYATFHPYAEFFDKTVTKTLEVRASRLTIKRAKKQLIKNSIEALQSLTKPTEGVINET